MTEPLRIAVVGHTNAGKTSLLRTLTRRVDFGEVSDRPGTTRHTESVDLLVDGRVAVRYFDTPGLEDSVALLEYLQRLPGETRPERVRAFLRGPEARGTFEQEAKVLRALLEQADAAMYVIDAREPVLPKYRAECEILTWCARPVLPVLNFVAAAGHRAADWRQALLEANLHAQVEFDAVAPFVGAERQLYGDLATLLRARRPQLQAIIDGLAREEGERRQAACRVVAEALVSLAALRRPIDAAEFADPARQQTFIRGFQDEVRARARQAVRDVLAVFAFRPDDADFAELAHWSARWEDDLFNPEILLAAGRKLGVGAAVGAGLGVVADVAMAGLSLGAATALGATLGGAVSGGWRPLWRKLENRLNGVQELTLEDDVLLVLTEQLLLLILALERRGHAATERLHQADVAQAATTDTTDGADGAVSFAASGSHDGPVPALPAQRIDALFPVLRALAPARGHPEWAQERAVWRPASWSLDDRRAACVAEVTQAVRKALAWDAPGSPRSMAENE